MRVCARRACTAKSPEGVVYLMRQPTGSACVSSGHIGGAGRGGLLHHRGLDRPRVGDVLAGDTSERTTRSRRYSQRLRSGRRCMRSVDAISLRIGREGLDEPEPCGITAGEPLRQR